MIRIEIVSALVIATSVACAEPIKVVAAESVYGDIARQIGDSVLGLGPLEPFVRDPDVSEIMVNGWDTIYVERAGKLYWTGTKFHDDQQLRRTIDKIVGKVGRRVDEASPYVDARLPDGSRVNAVIPPLSIDGPALTIRKFAADPYQADDLIEFHYLLEDDTYIRDFFANSGN